MLTIQQFRERFKTNEDCLKFLIEGKWGGGYQCPKCNEYVKGRKWFYRRCRTCMYDESVTANTGLHKCKLELVKVFEISFRISVRKKGMSTNELSKEFGCQQKTAWLIKSKFQNMMASSNNFPLKNKIEIDEFLVGGIEEEKVGRSHAKKSLVVLGVEKLKDKKAKETIGRAYARVIDTASAKNFRPFFEKRISKDAKVETDGWRGYLPLNKDWDITKNPSDKGKGFPELHTHIMNIKSWIRGIHHKCSATRLQNYLDEFHFRFNRRSFLQSIFDKLLKRMVLNGPISYKTKRCEPST